MTTILLVVNVAAFVLQILLEGGRGREFFENYLYLSTTGLGQGFVWQLVTFQFLHGGLFHIIFNLLIIYFFGRSIEETLGSKQFLQLYLSAGVVGGLFHVLFAIMLPNYFGGPVIGASAGALGLIAAFASLYPERQLTLLLFFIIPVSMRARTLLWISIGLAVFGLVVGMTGRPDNVAHAAHLGGIFAGLMFVSWIVQGHGWQGFRRARRPAPPLVRTVATKPPFWNRPKAGAEEEVPEFISREVDPILDKISAHGIQSLTDREREILERARAKMARR